MAKIVVKRVWKRTIAENVYCVGTLYVCERCGATKVDWLKEAEKQGANISKANGLMFELIYELNNLIYNNNPKV